MSDRNKCQVLACPLTHLCCSRILSYDGYFASDERNGQHVGTFLLEQLFHLFVVDKGLWLTAQVMALHLNAHILQSINECGDTQQILVNTGAANSSGAAHGRIEDFNLFHRLFYYLFNSSVFVSPEPLWALAH